MPLKKVERGQRITGENLSAEFINRTIDLIQSQSMRGTASPVPLDPGVIRVQNTSGAAVDRNEVLILGQPIILPADNASEFLNNWALEASQSAAADTLADEVFRVVITLEPIPDGEIGRAKITGVAAVTIDVTDTAHDFASPKASTYLLKSEPTEGLRIIWKDPEPPGTGEIWALVRLGPIVFDGAIPVKMTQTGGADGSATAAATWTYTVEDARSDEELATDVDPTSLPHGWQRPPAGKILPATRGIAFRIDGSIAVYWINEAVNSESC